MLRDREGEKETRKERETEKILLKESYETVKEADRRSNLRTKMDLNTD